jgi:hypothetical protein
MEALERLVGTWKVETIDKIPEETRSTSIVRFEPVLGGRFVQQTGGFDDSGTPTQMGMYTYDSDRKNYRYWFFMSSGFYWEATGTWDESDEAFVFTYKPAGGGKGTITIRFLDETTYVWSLIFKDAGGEITHHLEGKCVRQK